MALTAVRVVGYIFFAAAGAVVVSNVVLSYLTARTGRFHSHIFVVPTILAVLGCRALAVIKQGCAWSTIVIVLALDFTVPFLSEWIFRLFMGRKS